MEIHFWYHHNCTKRNSKEKSFWVTLAPDHSECYDRDHYSFKAWKTYDEYRTDWCDNCTGKGTNLDCYVGIVWGKLDSNK